MRGIAADKSVYRSMMNLAVREKVRLKGRVLDLACGRSPSYYNCIRDIKDLELIRLDISSEARPTVTASLERPLPFKGRSMQGVLLFNAFYLVSRHAELISEIYRVLRPAGVFFLSVPFLWGPHPEPHDYYRYTGERLRYLFKASGFKQIEVITMGGYFLSALNLGHELFRHRLLRMILLIPACFFDRVLELIIKNYREKYPIGYFIYGRKT